MAAVAGVYRRKLPSPPAIEFSSTEGKRLFSEALHGGNMEGFFNLISYYQTQSEPAFCGLATLSTVLNALAIDPGRKWKGPWRWFDDTMLDCCEPVEKIKASGTTFDQVACLAHCNGANVEAFRTDKSTIEEFRNYAISCTSSEGFHLIVSYHRGYLDQTGSGHFSPIGGYHAGKDMVLILDVARFKYPPHWVPLTLLWKAMDTVDEKTGCYRGFMRLSKPHRAPSVLYTVSCRRESWKATAKYLTRGIPSLLISEEIENVEELLKIMFTSGPADLEYFISWIAEIRLQEAERNISEEEKARLVLKEEMLIQVQETELCKLVTRLLSSASCCKLEENDSLSDIASKVCCQAAQVFCGTSSYASGTCCRTTETNLYKVTDEKPIVMVSGQVNTGSCEQGIDVLVPCRSSTSDLCNCVLDGSSARHPSAADVITILLLALPPTTWSDIKHETLRDGICRLTSTVNLPSLLQEEIEHLRQQIHYLSAILCE